MDLEVSLKAGHAGSSPSGAKAQFFTVLCGAAEAAPFQNKSKAPTLSLTVYSGTGDANDRERRVKEMGM
jgi:hypothetical protein